MSKAFRVSLVLLILVVGLSKASAANNPTQVVSQAVGQADTHVVTSREVQISWILDKAMQVPAVKKGGIAPIPNRSDWVLKTDGVEFQRHLSQVLLELVVSMEAENFSIGQVPASEVQSAMAHVKDMVAGWAPWKNLEVSSGEFEQMMTRKLKARNFLKFKTDTSGVRVTEHDIKNYYDKNRLKFGNTPLAQVKPQIKDFLSQELLQERLKDWFEILKRKYRVKLLGT
jgi:hypothetical protein